jgi:GT2 family glycosyltransferase
MLTMVNRPTVTVIIVTHNSASHLPQCIDAVYKSARQLVSQIIVVDNASSDQTPQVAAQFDGVCVIRCDTNIGYGAANNIGLKHTRGKYTLLLNPDVFLQPGCLHKLVDVLEQGDHIAGAGPKLYRPDGSLDLAARRSFPTPLSGFFRVIGLSKRFPNSRIFAAYNMGAESPDEFQEIDSGTGACMLLRTEVLKDLGGFDDDYFMYGEDLDLCYRIKQKGWKIVYVPDAMAVHIKGHASNKEWRQMLKEFHRSMWIFYRKHYYDRYPKIISLLVFVGVWLRYLLLLLINRLRRSPRVVG